MGVLTFLILSLAVVCAFAIHDIPDRYDFQLNLEFQQPGAATFKFFYTYDRDNQLLKMAVKVLSLGWVGIGFSRNQFMPDTDVAIGWVDDSGRGFLQDRYAYTRGLPRLDQQQDWNLINATEQDGYTIIEMERPLETCDTQDDFTLNVGDTIYLLYAYHPMDPTSENAILQHQFRQSLIINLFGSIVEPSVPSDAIYMDINVNNVMIPSSDTTYWCKAQRIPQNIIDQTHYITSFEPILQENTSNHVHHMLVYKCRNLTNTPAATASGPCHTVHEEARACLGNLLIAGWAVGAGRFVYPENVAYPIGGERNDLYLLIEMHYDNPEMESDNIDNSGVRFTLTPTPRQYNAGVSGIGAEVNSNLFVPPNTDQFNIYGYCPSTCTNQILAEGGITVFANLLHTHTVGEAITLRHVRNGVELPPIDQNLFYDFDYQITNHITPREVLRGDDLIVECRYNSTGRAAATFGGESTNEEMCLSFIYYYPESFFTYCLSSPNTDQYEGWIREYAPERLADFSGIQMLGQAREFLESFDWTNDAVRDIESVNLNGMHTIGCGYRGQINQVPPVITQPYQPPDICASNTSGTSTSATSAMTSPTDGPGDGSGASQLMYSTAAILFLTLMALLF